MLAVPMEEQADVSLIESKPLSPLDSLFLWGERRDTMMHVAGLLNFSPPPGAGIDYLRDLVHEAQSIPVEDVQPPWNRKLQTQGLVKNPFRTWITDENLDLDYHVRHSALPSPGGERELGVLVSRLHSNALDMSRPPWELHFIEGLEGGRFAVYVKVHHSLIDGYSAMKLLVAGLSRSAEEADKPLFFANGLPPRRPSGSPSGASDGSSTPDGASNGAAAHDGAGNPLLPVLADITRAAGEVRTHTSSAITLSRRIAGPLVPFRRRQPELASLVRAPNSILNGRIGRNRRFATQQYSLALIKDLAAHFDVTVNDIFLSIVGGGLHTFLDELGELPKKSLVAFLPVNVRTGDDGGGGNALGAILAKVGSNIEDPVVRLRLVNASSGAAKGQLEGMTRQGIVAYSAYVMAPTGLQGLGAMVGLRDGVPINFNLCLSNVPGPREHLYLRGSRLEASYPVSIPYHSMALNVTLQSYADTVGIGFVGCRDTLPHLQRLAVYTGQALNELADAAGLGEPVAESQTRMDESRD